MRRQGSIDDVGLGVRGRIKEVRGIFHGGLELRPGGGRGSEVVCSQWWLWGADSVVGSECPLVGGPVRVGLGVADFIEGGGAYGICEVI